MLTADYIDFLKSYINISKNVFVRSNQRTIKMSVTQRVYLHVIKKSRLLCHFIRFKFNAIYFVHHFTYNRFFL